MKHLKLIHGHGEIKRIDKQIREAFKLIDSKHWYNLEDIRHNNTLIRKIEKLGFSYKSSSGATFIGKNQVIKAGLVTRQPPPLKYRIPTLIYDYDERKLHKNNWNWVFVVMIQPRINTNTFGITDDHDRQMSIIDSKLAGEDFHNENFGIYKGEVKLLDW